ncbi:hypothetical protein CR513_51863, partial [Mucuna pruriens]
MIVGRRGIIPRTPKCEASSLGSQKKPWIPLRFETLDENLEDFNCRSLSMTMFIQGGETTCIKKMNGLVYGMYNLKLKRRQREIMLMKRVLSLNNLKKRAMVAMFNWLEEVQDVSFEEELGVDGDRDLGDDVMSILDVEI